MLVRFRPPPSHPVEIALVDGARRQTGATRCAEGAVTAPAWCPGGQALMCGGSTAAETVPRPGAPGLIMSIVSVAPPIGRYVRTGGVEPSVRIMSRQPDAPSGHRWYCTRLKRACRLAMIVQRIARVAGNDRGPRGGWGGAGRAGGRRGGGRFHRTSFSKTRFSTFISGSPA